MHVSRSISRITLAAVTLTMLFPPVAGADEPADGGIDLFVGGDGGYHTYRIPAIVVAPSGAILAFCEGRKNGPGDAGDVDLLLRRSVDGGRTWTPTQVVRDEGDGAPITLGNPCPIVDRKTGAVHLLFCRNNRRIFHAESDDDGANWSEPVEISASLKKFDFAWTRLGSGPVHGIMIQNGPRAGRLVAPVWLNDKIRKNYRSGVVYSDDRGRTWNVGGLTAPELNKANECSVVELSDGKLALYARSEDDGRRAIAESDDGGQTWSKPRRSDALVGPVCQGSILAIDAANERRLLFFSAPTGAKRSGLAIRRSDDLGATWSAPRIIYKSGSGYSDLAPAGDGSIYCVYERGEKSYRERITLVKPRVNVFQRAIDPETK
jgi:sialidase-1